MIGYVKCFDNKTMPFKVSDNKLLKKYNKIWERVSNLMNTEFDSELHKNNKAVWRQNKYKFSRQKNTRSKCVI